MKKTSRQSGKVSFWDLVIVVLVGVLVYLLYTRGRLDQYLASQYQARNVLGSPGGSAVSGEAKTPVPAPVAAKTTAPQSIKRATPSVKPGPAPEVSEVAPAETPETAGEVTPVPAPASSPTANSGSLEKKPIQLATLDHRFWPKEVRLLRVVEFPVIINGREAGSISAPAGMPVALVSIRENRVVVKSGGATKELAAGDTDVLERAYVLKQAAENAPVPTATPFGVAAPGKVAMPWKPTLRTVH